MDSRDDLEQLRTAKELVNQLSVVLRTAHIHDTNNVAVVSVIDKMVAMANSLVADERLVCLELRGEFFYLNDYRIRYPLEYLLNFDFLIREFKKRELGSLTFRERLSA